MSGNWKTLRTAKIKGHLKIWRMTERCWGVKKNPKTQGIWRHLNCTLLCCYDKAWWELWRCFRLKLFREERKTSCVRAIFFMLIKFFFRVRRHRFLPWLFNSDVWELDLYWAKVYTCQDIYLNRENRKDMESLYEKDASQSIIYFTEHLKLSSGRF